MQPDHSRNKILRRQNPILGKPKHEALQDFIANRAARFPQQRPQAVTGCLPAVMASFKLLESDLQTLVSYLQQSTFGCHNVLSKIEAWT